MADEQRADEQKHAPRGRIRMPIDDRVPPDEWVAEQPTGPDPSPTQHAAALAEEGRRRREIEYGAGGGP